MSREVLFPTYQTYAQCQGGWLSPEKPYHPRPSSGITVFGNSSSCPEEPEVKDNGHIYRPAGGRQAERDSSWEDKEGRLKLLTTVEPVLAGGLCRIFFDIIILSFVMLKGPLPFLNSHLLQRLPYINYTAMNIYSFGTMYIVCLPWTRATDTFIKTFCQNPRVYSKKFLRPRLLYPQYSFNNSK